MASKLLPDWKVMFKLIKNDINVESDILIAMVHWYIVSNSSLKCAGTGEDKTIGVNENLSQFLPDNWNADSNKYSLRYISENKLYLLLATKPTDDTILLNFFESSSLNVSNLLLKPKDIIKSLDGCIENSEVNDVLRRIKSELFDPIFSSNDRKSQTSQTQFEETDSQSSLRNRPRIFPGNYVTPRPLIFNPLGNVGRGDLDPFSTGGGMLLPGPESGNIFGVPTMPRPPFNVPSGARYDPIRPPNSNTFSEPDPDHFKPPTNFDDFYM